MVFDSSTLPDGELSEILQDIW